MLTTNYLSNALAFAALLSSMTTAAPVSQLQKRDPPPLKFPFPTEKVRGVNLGGWFVLEPWLTPNSIPWGVSPDAVDEYTLCAALGHDAALSTLQAHWNSWITQDDFNQIAALGLNFVRIPIGYWSISPIDGDPYVQGAYDILGQALDWASAAGLSVMVDIHGAPGSQNGFDNSGRRGAIEWGQGDSVDQTLTALNQLRDDHASHPALAAIQLVNEPMISSVGRGIVESFYTSGYNNMVNAIDDNGIVVSLHDGFIGSGSWNEFLPGLPNILMDTHHYEVFDSGSLGMSPDAHVGSACAFGAGIAANTKSTISGEWTSAVTDCAKWLNGLGVGARYDGTYAGSSYIGSCAGLDVGTVDDLPDDYKTTLTRFTEAQLDAYEEASGWIFWAWKTESAPEWHFQNLTAAGIIPQPLTARKFPGQCN